MGVLNMLNTKYIIQPGQDKRPTVMPNPAAYGNAWFVDDYILVNNADEELEKISKFDPIKEAIIDKRFKDNLVGYKAGLDSTAAIQLIEYAPNHL
ncbi:MAG: hypothetical protein R2750_06570 [Bacteroidales bacterium]